MVGESTGTDVSRGKLRDWWVGVVGVLAAACGAAVLLGVAAGPASAAEVRPAGVGAEASALANPLAYQVQARFGAGCTREKTVTGLYGIPLAVDLGGSILPDVLVEVIPVPAIPPITDKTVLSLSVVKLSLGSVQARVEAVLSPSGPNDPKRVALGYDGCESGIPTTFGLTAVQEPDKLSLRADTLNAKSSLTVLGSTYRVTGGVESDPTRVAARFAPVPAHLTTAVDLPGDSKYAAHVTTSAASQVRLDFLNATGPKATTAKIELKSLPEKADVSFSSSAVSYTTSAAIRDASVSVTSTQVGEKTQHVSAQLGGLPLSAQFELVGTRTSFTTPGVLASATVRYATYLPGTTLPAAPSTQNQYASARLTDDLTLIDVRLLGVGTSSVDVGDTVKLDLRHLAGPFDVALTSPLGVLTGAIRDLPAEVAFSYGQKTQAISYQGSATIGQLTLDLDAAAPIVGRADKAHVEIRSMPTGLTGTLDTDAKKFSATTSGGRVGQIEARFTNGPTLTIPSGDGLLLHDPAPVADPMPADAPYELFVRVSQVGKVAVEWGEPLRVELVHDAAPFQLAANLHGTTLTGQLTVLPETAHVEYFPPSGHEPLRMVYRGSAVVERITADLVSPKPLFASATRAHVEAAGVPTRADIRFDSASKSMTANLTGGALASLSALLTSGPTQTLDPAVDGVQLVDRMEPEKSYLVYARLSGITSAKVSWADSIRVVLEHRPGPLAISLLQQWIPKDETDINTRTVNGRIDQLPGTVDVSYNPTTQDVDYVGSEPIGQITADVTSTPFPIAGRGNQLRFLAKDLPTDLQLRMSMPAGELESFSADTGGKRIGLLELAVDNGEDQRELLEGNDGLLLVDMLPPKGVPSTGEEPYFLFARATGLQKVTYSTTKDGNVTATKVGATLLGGRDLQLQMRKFGGRIPEISDDEPEVPAKKEGYTYFTATFQRPPANVNFDLTQAGATTLVDYRTDSTDRPTDSALDLATNQGGGRTKLTANVTPVPARAEACLSPILRSCAPEEHHNFPDGADSNLTDMSSYAVRVSEPVHVSLWDCRESLTVYKIEKLSVCDRDSFPDPGPIGFYTAKLMTLDLQIDKQLVLMATTNRNCEPNCKVLYLDTGDASLTGQIRQQVALYTRDLGSRSYDTELSVNFPPGFRTVDRIVQIKCGAGCSGQYSKGLAACPTGTRLTAETLLGDMDFVEEWCPGAQLSSITPNTLARGAVGTVDIRGAGFSPSAGVSLGAGVTVDEVEWLSYGHIRVHVTVAANAAVGKRDVTVTNPSDAGSDTRLKWFAVSAS